VRSSKNGGPTTIPTDPTRASPGSHPPSSQHAPRRGKTGTFRAAGFYGIPKFMPESNKEIQKRRRGRPATGRDPAVTSRLSERTILAVDEWATGHECTRAEAIRRLVEIGLASAPRARPAGAHKGAHKAKALAEREVDRASDPSASDEQRQSRKRRLLKGPTEFRELRRDLPKAKG
jgi:hypothetical protein